MTPGASEAIVAMWFGLILFHDNRNNCEGCGAS
eukprot:CAMPEP_0178420614 /NCGR_PEP_ID=MMETSP0689_2-20121128/26224_1 /TAXON_ID=160604 /ORGANISM="Amphidinium massartii, Strain CS-259" /LENGTH=32 /DNA_ID= /DNA_START= /DNA_END= /DNA_ORIENTATION=